MPRIEVWLKGTGYPLEYEYNNSYVKGGFFCIYQEEARRVIKYPIADIYRVIEDYPDSARRSKAD